MIGATCCLLGIMSFKIFYGGRILGTATVVDVEEIKDDVEIFAGFLQETGLVL